MEEKTEATETASAETTGSTQDAIEVAKTYTQEDMDALKTEYDSKVADLHNQNKGIRKLQSEAVRELNRLKSQPQSNGNTEVLEAMLKAIPKQQDEYGNPAAASPEVRRAEAILRSAKQREAEQKRTAYYEGLRQKAVDERLTMRKEIEEVGLNPDSEEFALVELAWDNNNPAAARKWLDKALGKRSKAEPKGDKVKSEDEVRADERAKVIKELTKQDVNVPSRAGKPQFTVNSLREYDAKGKSVQEMKADVDILLNQITKK